MEAFDLVLILAKESGGQAVGEGVRQGDGLVETVDRAHGDDRAEELGGPNRRIVGHRDDGGGHEVAGGEWAVGETATAGEHLSGESGVGDRCLVTLEGSVVDDGRQESTGFERSGVRDGFGACHESAGELLSDHTIDVYPRGGGAFLTGESERAPRGPLHGQIEIGLCGDDDWVLAAHLADRRFRVTR